jgi:hypothetical protein
MPLQATSGAASYDAFGGGVPVVPNYIEDVFSTYLYTGNGTSQTITNGIDLSTNGGLVWLKSRSLSEANVVVDSARGPTFRVFTNSTAAEANNSTMVSAFTSTGFSLGSSNVTNTNASTNVSWTFRKQPKFFDVVTYTGNGSARTISHNLGSAPGCIIVKATTATEDWYVYHRSSGNSNALNLNNTNAEFFGSGYWNGTNPTSTVFSVGTDLGVNGSGVTYVAYLFAHNAGGFGLTGTDNVISCGSYTTNGSGVASVTLGYEPQWILWKRSDSTSDWYIFDTMRGWTGDPANTSAGLRPNLSNAENNLSGYAINATGFNVTAGAASATYIYIAIRRGPMKVPTSGTSVFAPVAYTGTGSARNLTGLSNPTDLFFATRPNNTAGRGFFDRLRGSFLELSSNSSNGETTDTNSVTSFALMDGVSVINASSVNDTFNYISYHFRRAPSFFDEVCYTGTGSARTVTHNLAAVPEMMIVKVRDSATDWAVYHSGIGATKRLILNLTDTPYTSATAGWNDTAPTASVFTVGTNVNVNGNGYLYVAYLFATCAGVSKVFSYTGNGSSQTINCGFTGGARFVLIKRTDSTGDWYVWDSARGIVSGNDPHLSLNTTDAGVTTDDTIDTDSTGFVVNQLSATNVNVSSATYIGLAIA